MRTFVVRVTVSEEELHGIVTASATGEEKTFLTSSQLIQLLRRDDDEDGGTS